MIDLNCSSFKRADVTSARGTAQPERGRLYWQYKVNGNVGSGTPSVARTWNKTYLAARPTGVLRATSDFKTGCDVHDGCPTSPTSIWAVDSTVPLANPPLPDTGPALAVHRRYGGGQEKDYLVVVDIDASPQPPPPFPVPNVPRVAAYVMSESGGVTTTYLDYAPFGEPSVANYNGDTLAVWPGPSWRSLPRERWSSLLVAGASGTSTEGKSSIYLIGVQTTSPGLAASSWPRHYHDNLSTGYLGTPLD